MEEYINAAHEAGLREVRLIHGRGKGVQRGIVQQTLERHPLVAGFHLASFEEGGAGATIVDLGTLRSRPGGTQGPEGTGRQEAGTG